MQAQYRQQSCRAWWTTLARHQVGLVAVLCEENELLQGLVDIFSKVLVWQVTHLVYKWHWCLLVHERNGTIASL